MFVKMGGKDERKRDEDSREEERVDGPQNFGRGQLLKIGERRLLCIGVDGPTLHKVIFGCSIKIKCLFFQLKS